MTRSRIEKNEPASGLGSAEVEGTVVEFEETQSPRRETAMAMARAAATAKLWSALRPPMAMASSGPHPARPPTPNASPTSVKRHHQTTNPQLCRTDCETSSRSRTSRRSTRSTYRSLDGIWDETGNGSHTRTRSRRRTVRQWQRQVVAHTRERQRDDESQRATHG